MSDFDLEKKATLKLISYTGRLNELRAKVQDLIYLVSIDMISWYRLGKKFK